MEQEKESQRVAQHKWLIGKTKPFYTLPNRGAIAKSDETTSGSQRVIQLAGLYTRLAPWLTSLTR